MSTYAVTIVTGSTAPVPTEEEATIVAEVLEGAAKELAARLHGWEGDRVYLTHYAVPPLAVRNQVSVRLDNILPAGSRWPEETAEVMG